MYTQTKSFTLRLISDLIDNDTIVNIISTTHNSNPVERYLNNIEQEIIYGIENAENIVLFENDIIQKLLVKLEQSRNEDSQLTSRRLANTPINICLLDYKSTDEQRELFKQVVSK